jgi:FLYWCH zinc finger domain
MDETNGRIVGSPLVQDYLFGYDKRNANDLNVRYWRCLGREEHSCRVTATTDGNQLRNSSPVEMHCHPNDTIEIARREFKTDVKQQAVNNILINVQLQL